MYDAARAPGQDGRTSPDPGRQAAPHPGATASPDAVHALLRGLASQLGLDPARIGVEAAETEHGGPLGGARAAASEHGLLLRPSVLADPDPALLVHELAHLAQHRNRSPRPSDGYAATRRPRADLTASEAEAAALAGAARTGGALWRPRAVLPDGVVARDTGASGIAPRLLTELAERVAANHADEIARISEHLGSFWTSSGEAVESALEILDRLDFGVARTLVRCLRPDVREKLARLARGQYEAHPRSAVAVLSALGAKELTAVYGGGTYDLGQALAGLRPSELGAAELRGAVNAVRLMATETLALLDDLLRGPARDVLHVLLHTPAPPGTDEEQVEKALAVERRVSQARREAYGTDGPLTDRRGRVGEDTQLLLSLTALLSSPGAAAARQALDQIATLVSPREADGGPDGGAAGPAAVDRLSVLVSELDARGLLERLLDHLAVADRHQSSYSRTLSALLAVRRPALTLARIESLLSYGLLDWAVTDADARFAYLLLRSLPTAEQEAWRRRDGGKWSRRLQDNLPAVMFRLGEYQGLGNEYTVTGSGPDPDEKAIAGLLGEVLAGWRARPSELSAVSRIRQLIALGPDGREAPGNTPGSTYKLRAAVTRRLDAMGELPCMVAVLTEDHLLHETTRYELVALSRLRDPVNVQNHVVALFHGWFSAKEAWTAHQMLRGLTAAEQVRFDTDHPGLWNKITGSMSRRMRASAAFGALTGHGEFPHRDQLRARLLDRRLWEDRARRPELRSLLNLAYLSDDRIWALRQIEAHTDRTGLQDLFERMKQPEDLRSPGLGEVLFSVPGDLLHLVWFAGDALLQVVQTLGSRTMRLDLDLDDLQRVMGGDIMGAETVRSTDPGDRPAGKAKSNLLSIAIDPAGGTVTLDLPALDLRRLDIARPGASYHTGAVRLRGLKIKASYSDRHFRTPVGVHLDADKLDVRDAVLANPAIPGGVAALATLLLRNLKLRAHGTSEKLPEPRPGTIPIPLFGPLLQALDNLVALTGGVPGAPSLLDMQLMPFMPELPFLADQAVDQAIGEFDPTRSPFDYLAGLAYEGSLRPPRTIAQRVRVALDRLRAMEVSFDELSVTGLTLGVDQQISSVKLTDVVLGGARSLPSYLRLRKSALERLRTHADPGREDAVTAELATVENQLDGLKKKEERLEELEGRDRLHPGALSKDESLRPGSLDKDERAELARLSEELRADAGIVAEVGGIEVGALHGRVTAAGARVEGGVHLHARFASELFPGGDARYLADQELIARFLAKGNRNASAALLADPARLPELYLETGRIHLLEGPPGTPALRIAATSVPPADVLRARLDALEAMTDPATRERMADLRQRLADAVPLAREVEKWRGRREPSTQEEIEAEEKLLDLLGYAADTVEIGSVSGGFSSRRQQDRTSVVEAKARASGIRMTGVRGPGSSAAEITGAADAGVRVSGDTLVPVFSLDLTAQDVRTEKGAIGKIAVKGLTGSLIRLSDGYRVPDLWIDRIETTDLVFGEPGNGFGGRKVTLLGVSLDAELHQPEQGPATVVVNRLAISRIVGEGLHFVRTTGGGSLQAFIDAGALLDVRAEDVRYDMDAGRLDAGTLSAGGLDDVRYRIVSAASLTGGGPARTPAPAAPGRPASRESVVSGTLTRATGPEPLIAARCARAGDKNFSLEVDVTDLGVEDTKVATPTAGLTIRRTRISGSLRATAQENRVSVRLSDTELNDIRWRSGPRSITAPGPVTVGKIAVKDAVLAEAQPDSPDPAQRVRRLTVREVNVQDIRAPQVRYQDPPLDVLLGGDAKAGADGPHIDDITLTEFVLPFTASGDPALDELAARFEASDIHLPFVLTAGTLQERLRSSGRLDVRTLELRLRPGGTTSVRARGASGEAGLTLGRPGGYRHGLDAWFSFSELDTGEVTIAPQAVEIGGLSLPNLSLTSFKLRTGAGPYFLAVDMTEGGGVEVSGVKLAARLERYLPGEANPGRRLFKRAVLSRAHIDRVAFEGLSAQYGAGADAVQVTVPVIRGGAPATLTGIELGGPGGFVHTPGAADSVLGTLHADKLTVPHLRAEAAQRFRGDLALESDAIDLGFLTRGRIVLDMDRPSLRLHGEATLGDPHERVGIDMVGAGHLHAEDGTVKATGVHAEGLHYERPGVRIDVERASAPDAVLDLGDTQQVRIPDLDLDAARLRVDFQALGPASGAPDNITVTPDPKVLLEDLDGSAQLTTVLRRKPLGNPYDPRDVTIGMSLRVDSGMVDFERLAESIRITFDPPAGIPSHLSENPFFEVSGDQLLLKIKVVPPLLQWTLPTPADIDLARRHQVRILTLIERLNPKWQQAAAAGKSAEDVEAARKKEVLDAPQAIELTVVSGPLDLHRAQPLELRLASAAVRGRIGLDTTPLSALRVSGSLVPVAQTGRSGAGRLAFTVNWLAASSVDLTLGGGHLETGKIEIVGIDDAAISFEELRPRVLEARIRQAKARNIAWRRVKPKP